MLTLVTACSASVQPSTTRPARVTRSVPSPSITQPPPAPSEGVGTIDVDASQAAWTGDIDRVVGQADVSVAVGTGTRLVYLHLADIRRIPASTQKLLT